MMHSYTWGGGLFVSHNWRALFPQTMVALHSETEKHRDHVKKELANILLDVLCDVVVEYASAVQYHQDR